MTTATDRPRPPHSLAYLSMTSELAEQWSSFASKVLGVPVEVHDGEVRLRPDDAPFRLRIEPGEHTSLTGVGWLYQSEPEWAHAIDHARSFVELDEASPAACSARGVAGMASFVDPSGIRHELTWGPLISVSNPVDLPYGITHFVDGLGHVVILTSHVPEVRALLVDALGLSISDFRSGAYFLRCNHRHHSIALVDSGNTRMHHFMLEVPELDDVGRALDRAELAGAVARELGRHSNDQMFSFYALGPGGVEVEYGWGGRQVDSRWIAHEIDGGDIWGHQPRNVSGSKGGLTGGTSTASTRDQGSRT